jgi:CO dehydrogenase nickel-insertion accessory protein CooC1
MNKLEPDRVMKPLGGQRIGIFGRGGGGKSTCTVFLAKALAEAGYTVCVLDADSTNEGLALALGADHVPQSLLIWLGGTVFSGGPVTCPVDDPVPIKGARVRQEALPSQFVSQTPEGIRILQVGKMGPLGPGAGCDGPMTKIARDFVLESDGPAPVTVIDFKAGIEDASRGVVTSLDWVVLVIDPSYAGVQAAATMKTLLDQMHHGALPATRHLQSPELIRLVEDSFRGARTKGALYVLNKVTDAEIEYQLWQRLLAAELHATAVIRDDPHIREAWLEGSPLHSVPALAEAAKLVRALEEGRGAFVETAPTAAASPGAKF